MKLHHIAYVTNDVEKKARELGELLGLDSKAEPVLDEEKGVRILFVELGGGVQLELLEPLGQDSPTSNHLKKGGGLYHLCFEVDDLEETLQRVTESGLGIVVREPSAAPAIDGRRVAFVASSDRDLIEFVETDK